MNNIYGLAKQFTSKFPMSIAWRVKQHCKVLDTHLNEGEKILYLFVGQKSDGSFINIFNTYLIAFTNKRIILATKRVLFGYFFKSITPDMYNDLTIHRGLIWGNIVLDTVKEVIMITHVDKNALDDIETNVTEIMLKHKKEFGIVKNNKSTKK